MTGEFLWRAFTQAGLRCARPQGAFYLFPDFSPWRTHLFRRGIRADESLCADLLERTGVAVLPGRAFGVSAAELAVRVATVDYDGAVVLAGLRQHRPGTPAARRAFVHHHAPRLTDGVARMREYIARICQR